MTTEPEEDEWLRCSAVARELNITVQRVQQILDEKPCPFTVRVVTVGRIMQVQEISRRSLEEYKATHPMKPWDKRKRREELMERPRPMGSAASAS